MNKPGMMAAAGLNKPAPSDRVPVKALAMPDPENGDQMASPEPGDKVSYTVEGTVESIEGDEAVVKREAVNGQPVDVEEAPAPDADQMERDGLGKMAEMGGE